MQSALNAEAEASARGVPVQTPYQSLLGAAYARLHPRVRAAHEAPLTAEGTVDVAHGAHPLTPLFVRAMNLPAAGRSEPVTLLVAIDSAAVRSAPTMRWMRQIGTACLKTQQFARQGCLVEQSGAGRIEFSLRVDESGALLYQSTRCRFLGVPLPNSISPTVRAKVAPTGDGWHVDVIVEWRGRALCRYLGPMRPVSSPP
jgi:hypothetical protein